MNRKRLRNGTKIKNDISSIDSNHTMENFVRTQTISANETMKNLYRVRKEQSIVEHHGKYR